MKQCPTSKRHNKGPFDYQPNHQKSCPENWSVRQILVVMGTAIVKKIEPQHVQVRSHASNQDTPEKSLRNAYHLRAFGRKVPCREVRN